MKKAMTLNDFMMRYSTEEACMNYLIKHKWGNGFSCKRCGHSTAVKGRKWYYRRCKQCLYDESATANTLFHNLKFPIQKAFGMVYVITSMRKGMSSCELARQFGVHQETAWFFRRKVQKAMQYSVPDLLDGNVEVDETQVGGYEAGKPGRSKGKKTLIEIALEVDYSNPKKPKGTMKRAAAHILSDASGDAIKEIIDRTIDPDAVVTTDGWTGYLKALKGRWHNVEDSARGKNFELLHWYIFNLKNWLRGTHHHASRDHLQNYLDEFNFRFNRRNAVKHAVFETLRNMINMPKTQYSCLVAL